MCSRFAFYNNTEDIERLFKVRIREEWNPSFNIAPSQKLPVIIKDEFLTKKWGLDLGFTKIINAREETLKDKFKNYDECIILANGFYEWKNKMPKYFSSNDILQFKGIYKDDNAVIVTEKANSIVNKIHDRMPVILNHLKLKSWDVTSKMNSPRFNSKECTLDIHA